jgi:hypothetical protein
MRLCDPRLPKARTRDDLSSGFGKSYRDADHEIWLPADMANEKALKILTRAAAALNTSKV